MFSKWKWGKGDRSQARALLSVLRSRFSGPVLPSFPRASVVICRDVKNISKYQYFDIFWIKINISYREIKNAKKSDQIIFIFYILQRMVTPGDLKLALSSPFNRNVKIQQRFSSPLLCKHWKCCILTLLLMCGDQRFAELVHTGGSAERTGFGARKTAIILFRASFGQLFISCSIQSLF